MAPSRESRRRLSAAEADSASIAHLSSPRARRSLLAVALILPWGLAAALFFRTPPADTAPVEAPLAPSAATFGAAGPWGRLVTMPIVIAPPLEYIPNDPGPVPTRARWVFPGTTRTVLEAWLIESGVPATEAARLVAAARPEPLTGGLVLEPDYALVGRLAPETLGAIHRQLATTPHNPVQYNAPRFFGSVDEWFRRPPVSADTAARMRRLVYADGDFQHFGDTTLAGVEIGDAEERRRLAKMLLREKTLAVRVQVDPALIDSIADYWGLGGRRMDVRPLLESIAGAGPDASIDLTHLLPPFVRDHLYRYPQVTRAALDRGALANCFWTAMNFFGRWPYDDAFLDVERTYAALTRDFYLVHDQFRLGDVVLFSDAEGAPYHAAVYLADGLVFSKNGTSSLSPWVIVPLERFRGYYPQEFDGGQISYHRRIGW